MIVEVGHILRVQLPNEVKQLGRVVWVEKGRSPENFCYIEFPDSQELRNSKTRLRHYIKAPVNGSIETLKESVDASQITLVMETLRSERLLTDAELSTESNRIGLHRTTRRTTADWKAHRDKELALIAPILRKYTTDQLFGQGLLGAAAALRAKHLQKKRNKIESPKEPAKKTAKTKGKKPSKARKENTAPVTAARIEQALRKYFLRGAVPNALLPDYFNSGAPGTIKFCKTRTGRPDRQKRALAPRTPSTLKLMQLGYKRHMKKARTYEDAYVETLNDFWAESITYVSATEVRVKLVPESEYPTRREFIRAARSLGNKLSPEAFNLGTVGFASAYRARRGTARDGVHAIGQIGVLDATSEDYTPASTASRLLQLPTPWRTMLVDAFSEYVYGVYRGFERGGTGPGLMAVLHAESDKEEWAAGLDFELKKDQWHRLAFKLVRGDNGDLKSELGMKTLTATEMSLEITASYTPQLKSVERSHQEFHSRSDHQLPGTTYGEIRARGQEKSESYLQFREGWPPLIRSILFHNNVELVPHLLTLEMRRADVEPTRKGIVEYCMAEGLVASSPTNLDHLRASCMPPLFAQGHKDKIEVWDPRETKGRRKIPHMAYFGEFMNTEAWQMRPVRDIEIRINVSELGEAYFNFNGLHRLRLLHPDPERHLLTLADWLFISDADNLTLFLSIGKLNEEKASKHRANQIEFAAAKAEKDREAANSPLIPGTRQTSQSKRMNLEAEKDVLKQHSLGLAPAYLGLQAQVDPTPVGLVPVRELPPVAEEDDSTMNALRKQLK